MSPDQPAGPSLSVSEIADLVGGTVTGDASLRITGVAPLDQAGPGSLGFLAAGRYASLLPSCSASALLVAESLAEDAREHVSTLVIVTDAHDALATLLAHWFPETPPEPGVHPTAVLGRGVRLGEEVSIGPYAVLEADVELADRVVVGPHCCIGAGAHVGADTRLFPHVVVYPGAHIGARVILHAGVRLGVDGFGYVLRAGLPVKVPQVGRCVVEDDVEIGANSCLDRGSIGNTVVGRAAKLDNLVHLGHNARVGSGSMLAAMTGVAGSSRLGRGVVSGGQVGVSGHLEIGDGAKLGAQAGVIGDVAPGQSVSGYPARPHRTYLRAMSQLFKLPELVARVRKLEDALRAAESRTGEDG